MTKNEYLNTLNMLLNEYNIPKKDIEDMLSDYKSLWEGYESQLMTNEDIVTKLGKPEDIISELTEGYQKISHIKASKRLKRSSKFIALTPFIALSIFFVVGFTIPGAWMYAWLAFLLIPMSAIITQGPKPILLKLTALSPFIALIIFFLILGPLNLWHPGWVIFLIIPGIGILNDNNMKKKLILESLLIFGVILYIFWSQQILNGEMPQLLGIHIVYAEFALLPFVSYVLIDGLIKMRVINIKNIFLFITLVGLYVFVSMTFDLWAISWLLFFIIPVYAILSSNSTDKVIAIMPFISTTLFMLTGYFFNWWAFAWIVFLLIPVTAIIKGK